MTPVRLRKGAGLQDSVAQTRITPPCWTTYWTDASPGSWMNATGDDRPVTTVSLATAQKRYRRKQSRERPPTRIAGLEIWTCRRQQQKPRQRAGADYLRATIA
jgi:hypothetical protein